MRKLLASLLIGGAALGGSVIATAPAMAAELCPTNKVCLFDSRDYASLLGYRSGGLGLANMSAGANDKMSSWKNRTIYTGAWYTNANGGGSCYNLNANTNNPYVGFAFNDKASSWKTNRGC